MNVTAFDIAQRFIGTKEVSGVASNSLVLAMLRLDGALIRDDEVPWCSAFANFVAWILRLPRSKSLAARSWLNIGTPVGLHEATVGFDVAIFKRGGGQQPGPEVVQAPGHVGFFGGYDAATDSILLLGGNQGDAVTLARFPAKQLLGLRRLA